MGTDSICLTTTDDPECFFCLKILPILPMSGHVHEHHWIVQEFKMSMSSLTKWLTVINHSTSSHTLEAVVREEYHVVCTDVNPDSKDIREANWEACGKNCWLSWAVNNTELAMKGRPRLASTDVRLLLSFGNMELNFQRIQYCHWLRYRCNQLC